MSAELPALEPSPELRAVWTDLVGRWDDMKAHDAAVASIAARAELAAMGRLYRIRLARQPLDPIALRGRDEVVRIASSATALGVPADAQGADAVAARSQATRQALLWGAIVGMAVVMVILLRILFTAPVVE
jgi:hypothetical protein